MRCYATNRQLKKNGKSQATRTMRSSQRLLSRPKSCLRSFRGPVRIATSRMQRTKCQVTLATASDSQSPSMTLWFCLTRAASTVKKRKTKTVRMMCAIFFATQEPVHPATSMCLLNVTAADSRNACLAMSLKELNFHVNNLVWSRSTAKYTSAKSPVMKDRVSLAMC